MTTGAAEQILARRYRLLRPIHEGPRTTLWRGVDETLARPVAIKILDDRTDVDAFLAGAMAAGRLAHPRIASTYDADVEDGLPYVVVEWVEGSSLADLLRDGPLPPPRATTVVAQVAEALVHAHGRGVRHRDLDAGNVLVCSDGSAKVTDFELGAVLGGAGTDDVKALGALLYAALTGKSAYGAESTLPRAPERNGRLCTPRQVRAAVPRELDAIVARTLLPTKTPITTPAEMLTALAPLPGDSGGKAPVAAPEPQRRASRWLRIGVPSLVVLAVGGLALLLGLAIGEVPPPATPFAEVGPPTAAPDQGVPVRPVAARDFDPDGDKVENRTAVQLAYDNDGSTAWETSRYRNNPSFGGLKPGVGIVFDLGTSVSLSRVDLAFPTDGVSVELRAADAPGEAVTDFPVVASVNEAKQKASLTPRAGTRARYWLVWVTRLVPVEDGRFQAGVAEVAFFR